MDSKAIGNWSAMSVPVVDEHEPAAGKIAALLARQASRDLFDDATLSDDEVRDRVLPVLRATEAGAWASTSSRHVDECRKLLGIVLPLEPNEREFLDKLLDHGEIDPSLLTEDPKLAGRIKVHPGLLWKAANVRGFRVRR